MKFRLTILAFVITMSAELTLATEKTAESDSAITAPIKTAPIINKKQSLGIPHQSGNDVTSSEATPVTDGEITSSEATPVTETEADLERRAQARRDAEEARRSRAERRAQARTEHGEQARDRAKKLEKTRAKNQVEDAIGRAQQAVEAQPNEQVREDIADSRIEQQEQMGSINKKMADMKNNSEEDPPTVTGDCVNSTTAGCAEVQ